MLVCSQIITFVTVFVFKNLSIVTFVVIVDFGKFLTVVEGRGDGGVGLDIGEGDAFHVGLQTQDTAFVAVDGGATYVLRYEFGVLRHERKCV